MCVLGLLIFYFWPTAAPSPDIDWTQYPDMDSDLNPIVLDFWGIRGCRRLTSFALASTR